MRTLSRAFHAALLLAALPVLARAQAGPGQGVLHGYLREAATGEPLGSGVLLVGDSLEARSERDGYFRVPRLSAGAHRVRVRAPGYTPLDTVLAPASTPAELRLHVAPLEIPGLTVAVVRGGERAWEAPDVAVQRITPAEVRRVPAALETDLFRSIQALPGVSSPSAFSGQMFVRGGAGDQNLFLLDGYPVIHPYHLGGGFSAFHVDAIRDAEFWTGAPPARYGGRLSSVLDVALREGNRERLTGTASVSPVSSAAVVEGPHARGAWFVGARATYFDVLTGALKDAGAIENELPYRFYDAYAKAYADLTPSDRVSGLVFMGRDAAWRAGGQGETFDWNNDVFGLSWRHLFGGRALFEQRVSYSRFHEELLDGPSRLQHARIDAEHRLGLASARGDLRLDVSGRHQVEAGYAVERHTGDHRNAYVYRDLGKVVGERQARTSSLLGAVYAQDEVTVTGALRLRLGVRGEFSDAGSSLQPRASARYVLSDRVALTAGAGLLQQRIQLVQDPDANLSTYSVDIWVPADGVEAPVARASHLVGGVEMRLPAALRFRAEGYQKGFSGLVTLPPYAPTDRRFAFDRLQTADGRARGLDVTLAREEGALRGWLGYSLASSTRTVDAYTFAADPHPRQRLVAVWEAAVGRGWGMTGRFEAFQGIPYTPAVSVVPHRPFDFARGGFTDRCETVDVDYIYGPRNSSQTGLSKRLDLGAGRRWTDGRGRKWELGLSLLNALFDPTGVFRPTTRGDVSVGCDAPAPVLSEPEMIFPAIPSIGIRVSF
jgi:hypothetical protein